MQKKYLAILMACIAALALLSGCAGHTHQPSSDTWEADFDQHWQVCADCGQRMNEGKHSLDDSDTCTVCGAQPVDWGDSKSVYQFNKNGDPLKMVDYDADGNIITESIYTYEYDADGNLTRSTATTDGVLTEESLYTLVDGESVISQLISYLEDGSKVINDYDAYENSIRMSSYDADGKLTMQSDFEYAQTADGQWYEAKCSTTEADGTKSVSEYNEDHDQISLLRYATDGSLTDSYVWDYSYDADGNWQSMKYYCNDTLCAETIYATATTESGSTTYPETVTEYHEDGSKTVTVYSENDEILSQTHYDANGNVING